MSNFLDEILHLSKFHPKKKRGIIIFSEIYLTILDENCIKYFLMGKIRRELQCYEERTMSKLLDEKIHLRTFHPKN